MLQAGATRVILRVEPCGRETRLMEPLISIKAYKD